MNRTRNATRTIGINLVLILALIGLLVVGPIAAGVTFDLTQRISSSIFVDSRTRLPNYRNISWADQHFKDLSVVASSYSDYVVWKFDPLSTETINIDDQGIRATVVPNSISSDEYWLFGGSTVFGTGADDSNTIPSLLAETLRVDVVNYGQDGYVGRQSMIRLLQEYGFASTNVRSNRTVVFYDGINDVNVKCRYENRDLVTDRQSQIRSTLGSNRAAADVSFNRILKPMAVFLQEVRQRIRWSFGSVDIDSLYICDDDSHRADLVARTLVGDWKAAQAIAERNGDRFLAVLQPVSYLSDTKKLHLQQDGVYRERRKQFAVVYPLIRQYAVLNNIEFVDLTDVLNIDEYIYIDESHVSPNGNKYVANEIAEKITVRYLVNS